MAKTLYHVNSKALIVEGGGRGGRTFCHIDKGFLKSKSNFKLPSPSYSVTCRTC